MHESVGGKKREGLWLHQHLFGERPHYLVCPFQRGYVDADDNSNIQVCGICVKVGYGIIKIVNDC